MKTMLLNELKHLLNEEESSIRIREQTSFDPWKNKILTYGIILFGSGGFGKRTLKGLRKIGIEPLGFCDNNPTLWNSRIDGLTVYSPADAVNKFSNAVFMVTIWSDMIGHPVADVEKKLHLYGNVEVISFFSLFWQYPEEFLPYFGIDAPHKTSQQHSTVIDGYNLFNDELSQREYLSQIRLRLLGDHQGLSEPGGFTQYFPDDLFNLNDHEVFVDCGAFNGDTLKAFLGKQKDQFKKYIAFEPDPINFNKLREFASALPDGIREKIVPEQFAVSDRKKEIRFSSDGSLQSSFSENGNIVVNCVALDSHLKDDAVSYIKMDAEGSEPEILLGAAHLIRQHSPILAVSVYHQFDHLWSLPLAIKELTKEYDFFLRPHCKASWDLICYAIPRHRSKQVNSRP